jgi:hypothetical protein
MLMKCLNAPHPSPCENPQGYRRTFLLPKISLFLYSESGEGRDAPGDGPCIGAYPCRQWRNPSHLSSIPEVITGREGLKFHR